MKHTKWTWEVYELNRAYHINAGFTHIASLTGVGMPNSKANAELIAEAGTVANESGLTPRQLLEQRNELLEATKELLELLRFHGYIHSSEISKAQQVIRKATETENS